jgi:hypothetical protein
MLDHGFLSVFNTHFLFNMHRFKGILVLVIVDYDEMSISTARGCPKPEATSPVDRATTVFACVPATFSVHLIPFRGISGFSLAETGEMSLSDARGRAAPEVTSPFDSLTPLWFRLAIENFPLSLTFKKFCDSFDYYCKCHVKMWGKDNPHWK